MNKETIFNSIKIIILGVLLSGVVTYAQTTWVSPAIQPVPSLIPINVGASPTYDQLKSGGLTLGSLAVFGLSQFNQDVSATFPTGPNGLNQPARLFYVSGKMGVGVISPTERLDIDGSIRIRNQGYAGPVCTHSKGFLGVGIGDGNCS